MEMEGLANEPISGKLGQQTDDDEINSNDQECQRIVKHFLGNIELGTEEFCPEQGSENHHPGNDQSPAVDQRPVQVYGAVKNVLTDREYTSPEKGDQTQDGKLDLPTHNPTRPPQGLFQVEQDHD